MARLSKNKYSVGGQLGGIAGAAVGQALIPIPGVGAAIGKTVGTSLGNGMQNQITGNTNAYKPYNMNTQTYANGGTLNEYYQSKGQSMPSIQERKALAKSMGIENYTGNADQNAMMLSALNSQVPASYGNASTQTGLPSTSLNQIAANPTNQKEFAPNVDLTNLQAGTTNTVGREYNMSTGTSPSTVAQTTPMNSNNIPSSSAGVIPSTIAKPSGINALNKSSIPDNQPETMTIVDKTGEPIQFVKYKDENGQTQIGYANKYQANVNKKHEYKPLENTELNKLVGRNNKSAYKGESADEAWKFLQDNKSTIEERYGKSIINEDSDPYYGVNPTNKYVKTKAMGGYVIKTK